MGRFDGTFYKSKFIGMAVAAAEKWQEPCCILHCVVSEEIVRERLEKRAKRQSVSDADYEVYKKLKSEFEPITAEHCVINCGGNFSEEFETAVKKVEGCTSGI